MSRYTWILDNGHGGVINGVPQTAGHRSPVWADGTVVYEGEFTRAVVNYLAELLQQRGIQYVKLTPQCQDIGLYERMMRIKAWERESNAFLLTLHANGNETGVNVLSMSANSKAADVFRSSLAEEFDGSQVIHLNIVDDDKESRADIVKMLQKAKGAALALQLFNMNNEFDCKELLMNRYGRQAIALSLLSAILWIEEHGF